MADREPATRREVVACVVVDGGRMCLVRRSRHVSHDQCQWHCVTGYREHGERPVVTALRELSEELELDAGHIDVLRPGKVLQYVDGDVLWVVHTFLARTRQHRFQLNWENDAYAWAPYDATPHPHVWWLTDVCASVLGPEINHGQRAERRASA
jgi:8-oxo-dGTP pyrophosphatase MutT (NUDIX family)